jgi:hypothetical protein
MIVLRRLLLGTVATVLLGVAGAGFGAAQASGPSLTPNGWIGACNMARSDAMFGFYSDPPTGPMTHDGKPGLPLDELQGNVGMSRAVAMSGGCV